MSIFLFSGTVFFWGGQHSCRACEYGLPGVNDKNRYPEIPGCTGKAGLSPDPGPLVVQTISTLTAALGYAGSSQSVLHDGYVLKVVIQVLIIGWTEMEII
jgi:hypothetical protein